MNDQSHQVEIDYFDVNFPIGLEPDSNYDEWYNMPSESAECFENTYYQSNAEENSCYQALQNLDKKCLVLVSDNEQPKKTKKPKNKVPLTPSAQQFKKKLYRIISKGQKNIVRKEVVFYYHSIICDKFPKIRNVVREEYRSIGNYFNSFASQQHIILNAIQEIVSQEIIRAQYGFCTLTPSTAP